MRLGQRPVDAFRGLLYRLEPDYTRPPLSVPADKAERIRRRVVRLYGHERAEEVYREIERVMRVHHAHATDRLLEAEAAFDGRERFTERDVVLITYGDLIVSGTRSPLRTLSDFVQVFFHGLVTTVHLLPFFPYSSDRGFSVISYEEVDPRLGTWEEIGKMGKRFKLMFDGVFNHVSSKSRRFQRFLAGEPGQSDWFRVFSSREAIDKDHLRLIVRPRTTDLLTEYATVDGPRFLWTTFSADQIDLNFRNPKVLAEILEILLIYVRRGADVVRLDAITYLWYELGTRCAHLAETHEVVKLFRDVLDVVAPHVALITETNVPHADNVTYFGDGSDEAQLVYNFALPPLVLHAFQTGNAEVLTRWAASVEPPSATTSFFNFLDSHDGIGLMGARGILPEEEILAICRRVEEHGGLVSMKSNGDGTESPYELNTTWFSALNREGGSGAAAESDDLQIQRFIASRAIAQALRGIPGIYLPSFFGSRNDPEAVRREGAKRSINRATLKEEELFDEFADGSSRRARVLSGFLALLEQRTSEPAFHPNGPQSVLSVDPRVFCVARRSPDGGSRVLCLTNVDDQEVPVSVSAADAGFSGRTLTSLLGARDRVTVDEHVSLTLKPYEVVWLKG